MIYRISSNYFRPYLVDSCRMCWFHIPTICPGEGWTFQCYYCERVEDLHRRRLGAYDGELTVPYAEVRQPPGLLPFVFPK